MQQANIPDSSDPIHLQATGPGGGIQSFPVDGSISPATACGLQTAAHLKHTGHVLTLICTYFNLLGSNHYKIP